MSIALAAVLIALAQTPASKTIGWIDSIGKVREVGGGPAGSARAILELDDKTELVLYGMTAKDDEELRRLSGVRVRVHALHGDPTLDGANHVRVGEYEIVDVGGGAVPRVGTVASVTIDGSKRLLFVDGKGNAELLPKSWAQKMSQHVGSKIWVVGASTKSELTPSRFAVLRPAQAGAYDSKD